ncbi:BrnT family toxin [Malonomonas rubra]|nr:BrnT family toxin [Malonomonas rubra]
MSFEYVLKKSAIDLEKHGIDFDVAQNLWVDPDLLEIPAKTIDEPRYLVIGKIGGKHWSAVVIYREGSLRLILFRRSRQEEIELYES